MSTTTTKRPRKQVFRTMQFFPVSRLLFIHDGRGTVGYTVEETTHLHNADEHVRSFQLTKPDGTSYDVLLDGPGSLCDCKGFEHRGMHTRDGKGCKHVAALTTLCQLNRI